jgi:KaiC/GvpD/RAD55 family RecA-like ATPase
MEDQESKTIVLELSDRAQEAVFGHMLGDYKFFLKSRQHLRPEYFGLSPDLADLVRLLYDCYNDLPSPRPLTVMEFTNFITMRFAGDHSVVQGYKKKIEMSLFAAKAIGLDSLVKGLTRFIKVNMQKELILRSRDLYKRQQFVELDEWISQAAKNLTQASFDDLRLTDFSDPRAFYAARKVDRTGCCTLGHPLFDNMVSDGQTTVSEQDESKINRMGERERMVFEQMSRGGLFRGETTIFLGATNSGKTTSVITVVAANIKIGKKVLYITHEQKEQDIQDKIYQAVSGRTKTQLQSGSEDSMRVLEASRKYLANLHHYHYIKVGSMYVENVIAQIRVMQENEIATSGAGYDLLVVDYPGILKSTTYSGKKNASGWEETWYVYDQFRLLALEYKFHALLPAQTNREGFKVNRGDSDRMLDAGDIGQSYGIAQIADNLISINRSSDDVGRNLIRFFIGKSRNNKTHYTFLSATAFERATTHGLSLTASVVPPGKQIDAQTLNAIFGGGQQQALPKPSTDA